MPESKPATYCYQLIIKPIESYADVLLFFAFKKMLVLSSITFLLRGAGQQLHSIELESVSTGDVASVLGFGGGRFFLDCSSVL
ncbi:MAG: hypothetical protein Ct9H300mP25_08340 [Acidobacteriota bacterium]|nr:MAG: hypothetical protein Ct9H300mP25_08340 [Acidobacteriota bacterium]